MSVPRPESLAAYVDAALAVAGYALPPDASARVHEQFARIAAIAGTLDSVAVLPEDEMAPVFSPAGPR